MSDEGFSTGKGSQLLVVHTERTMKAYSFTDADLENIGTLNIMSTACLSFGLAVLTFCIDVKKDLVFIEQGEATPTAVQALNYSVNFFGLPVAGFLLLLGGLLYFRRGGVIRRVKAESVSGNT